MGGGGGQARGAPPKLVCVAALWSLRQGQDRSMSDQRERPPFFVSLGSARQGGGGGGAFEPPEGGREGGGGVLEEGLQRQSPHVETGR